MMMVIRPAGLVWIRLSSRCCLRRASCMGREMRSMTLWEMLTPTMAPRAMAIAELISRLRRSTRCSKNDIFPPASCSGGVAKGSDGGVVIRRFLLGWGRRVGCNCRRVVVRWRRTCWGFSVNRWLDARHGSFWFHGRRYVRGRLNRRRHRWRRGRSGGGLSLTNAGLALQLAHFFFQGVAEIASHFAKFSRRFAKHPGQLRQLLRAEDNQGHD